MNVDHSELCHRLCPFKVAVCISPQKMHFLANATNLLATLMSVDTASCTLKETCIVMSFEGCSVASLKDTVIILSENKFVRTLELKDLLK